MYLFFPASIYRQADFVGQNPMVTIITFFGMSKALFLSASEAAQFNNH